MYILLLVGVNARKRQGFVVTAFVENSFVIISNFERAGFQTAQFYLKKSIGTVGENPLYGFSVKTFESGSLYTGNCCTVGKVHLDTLCIGKSVGGDFLTCRSEPDDGRIAEHGILERAFTDIGKVQCVALVHNQFLSGESIFTYGNHLFSLNKCSDINPSFNILCSRESSLFYYVNTGT
ncbi:hypothetical protein Barb6_02690 [Bacteroidales bacterium Barb6]|nr:hypothetical protein Barb6_02690 [Bacteroidales bacterium Barb6]